MKVDNIGEIARAGADMFVAGSAIFGAKDTRRPSPPCASRSRLRNKAERYGASFPGDSERRRG